MLGVGISATCAALLGGGEPGVAQGATTMTALPAMTSVGATAAFRPWDLANCEVALRSDLGVTLNGANVSQWDDQSGAGHHVVQAVAASQPLFAAAGGPNGTPRVICDGVDDFLKAAGFTWNQKEEIFAIVKPSTANDASGTVWDGNTTNGMRLYISGVNTLMYAGAGGGLAITKNTFRRLLCLYNGTSSFMRTDEGDSTAFDVGANNSGGLTLGSVGGAPADPGDCEMVEIVGYKVALTTNAVALLLWYAGARYGL